MSDSFKSFTKIDVAHATLLAENTLKWIREDRLAKLEKLLKEEMAKDRRSLWQRITRQTPIYMTRDEALTYVKLVDDWYWSDYDRIMEWYANTYDLANNVKIASAKSSDGFIYINIDELKTLLQ